jgi:ATP-binding protein involved in chromosome partitioning
MNNHLTRLEDDVSRALNELKDPLTGRGLIQSGRVQGLTAHEDGRVSFTIEAPAALAENFKKIRDNAEAAARKVRGVKRVLAVLTAEAPAAPARAPPPATPPRPPPRAGGARR